jgi:hypothetical protein
VSKSERDWLDNLSRLTPVERDRKVRALQRSLRNEPLRTAAIRAKLLTLELGGPSAPAAADAWRRVREIERPS